MNLTLSRQALRPWAEQPRKHFGKEKMRELADSLRAVGQLQALVVRPLAEAAGEVTHEIIVGERRWRAAESAGLPALECKVVEIADREAAELALMENVHRDDLTAMEEAHGYKLMVSKGWSVAEIADRFGKKSPAIYELLDLCELDEGTQQELTDGTITVRTARTLGRIEDDGARAEARQRIVQPRTQDQPLPQPRALLLIQEEYLEPQKRAKEWEKQRKQLLKEYPGAEIVALKDAGRYTGPGSEWEAADDPPADYELASHVREGGERVPTWGELAERHGAAQVLVPDADGKPLRLVPREPILAAELTAGEKNPQACIFPIAGGEGRHQQSLAGQRAKEEEKADEAKRREQALALRAELAKRLQEWLMHPVKGAKADELHAKLPDLAEWAMPYSGALLAVPELMELLGIDAVAKGDGDADEGARRWLRELVDARGTKAYTFLLLLEALETMPEFSPGFPEAVQPLADALGTKEAGPAAREPEDSGPQEAGLE